MKSHIQFFIQVPGIGARLDGTEFLDGCVVSGVESAPPRFILLMEFYRILMAIVVIEERRLAKQRAASRRYRERKRAGVTLAVPKHQGQMGAVR